ncbi:hypothetical protein C2G38_630217 [Gigaspora rosea]|uniref:Uncharacterized protein n=1 Tax=Gigaspora rosea TaxID=44941 RepID=A0A397U7H6_9GLOM|nr:hypothetical protein C2G38_630217 [Gigaspora rosea]
MTSAESLHLSVPLEVVDCSCSGFGAHVWCNGHQHAITTKDNFVYLICENEHIIEIQIDKDIDSIWFLSNVNLAMLNIRTKAKVIVRNKEDHPTPDSEKMFILCATRDLIAFKKFISHFKNPEYSVQIKLMDDDKFKSSIQKYFDSDGNVLPSGKIKNPLPLMRTQLLGRNTSPQTSRHGKEICRNTSVSSSANLTNTASHSTLPNANSNHLSNSTDEEEVIVVSSMRKRNSLNRKRSGPSSDLANETEMNHESNPDFLTKFSGGRLKKKYKSSTDIVTYSNHRSNNSAKSPRTYDDDFIISPNKKRTSLISTQTRQRADSSLDQVEETDVRFRRRFRLSTNSGNNSKEPSSTLTKENASTSPKYVDPDLVILDSPDRRSKIQSLGRRDPNSKLFEYHCVGYSSLLITGSDYNRLIGMDELNDNLIVFYMRYALNQLREHDEAKARKYYLFDSYFYKKLSDLRDAK